jgi:hypothetical protein
MNCTIISAAAAPRFGFDAGVIRGSRLYVRQARSPAPRPQAVVAAIAPAGVANGAALIGRMCDRVGRRHVTPDAGLLRVARMFVAQTVARTNAHSLRQIEAALQSGHTTRPSAQAIPL